LPPFARLIAALVVAVPALAGCGGGSASSSLPTHDVPAPPGGVSGASGINHIVIVIQENRSFDNLFRGFPGADTVSSGFTHTGANVPLKEVPLSLAYDVPHHATDFFNSFHGGKMDGFDRERETGAPLLSAYAYVRRSDVQPYWDLAQRYTLADRTFSTQFDASYSAHQYLIAATSGGAVDVPTGVPWGCDAPPGTTVPTLRIGRRFGPGVFPCFDYQTIADELDAAKVSWRYYAPLLNANYGGQVWEAFDAVRHIRNGADWQTDIATPETAFLTDVHNGHLAGVTWIAPDFSNSDHAGVPNNGGPDWVASIASTVGASQFWKDTVVIVLWDDWGGWYDHVPPPQLDLHGLGIRVPMIVVSPYAKHGYVSHVQYEWGSILKFIEHTFALSSLAASDARANSLDDCLDFTQTVRPFAAIRTRRKAVDFIHATPSGLPPDSD
jgi:phospholipase C